MKEKEYARRLADYVRTSPFGDRWQVSAFTHPNACKQFLKQGYGIDLLAAVPELLRELQPELSHVPTIALVNRHGESGEKYELLQYQSLPQLLRGISELFEAMSQTNKLSDNSRVSQVKIITVHSASGRVGKTSLSLHLAHAASALDHRTFYLNLERWNTASLWLGDDRNERESGASLSDLLYGIKTRSQASAEWLLQHRKYHSLLKCDYLTGFTNAEDRLSLSSEDAIAIVNTISQSGHYDFIVIDMDDGLEELHVALLERADHNFCVVTDERSVHLKQLLAHKYGGQKWGDRFQRLLRKSVMIRNRTSQESEGNKREAIGLQYSPYSLPEVVEWQSGETLSLLSSSQYRAAVGKLMKHVLVEGDFAHDS